MAPRPVRGLLGALFALLMVGAAPAPAPPAGEVDSGDSDHLVLVGADDPASPAPPSKLDRFEYMAYFPDHLQVHRGDIVQFAWRGDHTVTFHPGGQRPTTLLAPDELPGQVRVDGVFPSRDDCDMGEDRGHLPPCIYEGSEQYLNTGASPPSDEFRARIRFDAEPGTYEYFCSFHPQMRGVVEVVPDDQPVLTPAEVETARREQIARDTAAAEAVMARYDGAPARRVVDGVVRWRVHVGAATPDGRVHVLRYLPSDLRIAPGDEVEFVMPPAPMVEAHSASFLPLPDEVRAEAPGHYLDMRCELDGFGTGAPGVTGGLAFLLTTGRCPAGAFELVYHQHAYAQPLASPGGVVAGPRPVHDSGMMLTPGEGCDDACDPWTGRRLPSWFEATFPEEGTFEYWCFLHDPRGMAASITVGAA